MKDFKLFKQTQQVSDSFIVWKLQNFSVAQILREIKIDESRVSQSAILDELNFELYLFLHLFGD